MRYQKNALVFLNTIDIKLYSDVFIQNYTFYDDLFTSSFRHIDANSR